MYWPVSMLRVGGRFCNILRGRDCIRNLVCTGVRAAVSTGAINRDVQRFFQNERLQKSALSALIALNCKYSQDVDVLKKYFGLAAMGLMFSSHSADAQTAREVTAMQYTLSQLSLYEGKIDGRMGKGTRAALTAYQEKFHTEKNFWAVMTSASHELDWLVEWNDQVEKAILEELDEKLLDGPAARIKERKLFRNSDGAAACIYVNVKNKLGAYVGYQWLYFWESELHLKVLNTEEEIFSNASVIWWDSISADEAETWCYLGYIMKD